MPSQSPIVIDLGRTAEAISPPSVMTHGAPVTMRHGETHGAFAALPQAPASAPARKPPENDHWATFNVDIHLVERFIRYHKRHRFACAVETGTFRGDTTVGLARMVPHVYTIEVNPEFHANARPRLSLYPNITPLLGNSADVLKTILPDLSYPLFAYLDAHWGDYWPLREELKLLLSVKKPKLIMIHDSRVPGRSFGYDSYQGQACGLDYYGDLLPHDECRYAFNDKTAPNSANRGVVFIEHLLDPL